MIRDEMQSAFVLQLIRAYDCDILLT